MMEEDEEYLDGFDDNETPLPSMSASNTMHTEMKINAMMNKDYHMHEQLLPQTIIKIVKSMQHNAKTDDIYSDDYPFTETGFIQCPYEYQYETVTMFIDVSGFTKMTELLDAEGPWGGEKVAFYLNRYLEQVARIVASEGGDIFKFAGDAMIIIWPYDEDMHNVDTISADEQQQFQKETMGRAIQCGLNIQKGLHQTQFASGVNLSVKIGIGFGSVKVVFVGGTLDRCEYLACGEPLSQAFTCENNAKPGDVIIHRSIEQVIGRSNFQMGWIADSDCFKVEKQIGKKIRSKRKKGKKRKMGKNKKYEFTDAETVKRLNQFIPQAAKTRLVHRYRRWHQESRMMTVIFINLDFERFDKLPIHILQQILETMQIALYRYEGSLNKFMYDDKGATAVAVFGLPPICNFDDAARGVYAALQIEKVLKSLKGVSPENPEHAKQALQLQDKISQGQSRHGSLAALREHHSGKGAGGSNEDYRANQGSTDGQKQLFSNFKLKKVSIGVTSGRVYCGLLGSGGSGCEYGILGDLVNLSARLMQHAGKPKEKGGLGVNEGGVLCSKEIQIQCGDCRNLRFEKLKPIQVKGKSDHIDVYRPNYRSVLGETIIYRSRYNIGFEREYELVENKIKAMIHAKGNALGVIICVEGHHWYGATHFAREIMARLRQSIYIVGASAVKYEETQLVVWQALMARMTRECHLLHGDDEGFKDSVWRFFNDTGMEDILPAIWVANDLLGTKFHVEPEQEKAIDPETKMNFMVEIILHFLRVVSQYAPLLLVIVKHQFMSKDDWFLTHAVCAKIKSGDLRNVSVILAGWPQRNKSYSNRYSHRDAAMCYQTFREEYCGKDPSKIIGGQKMRYSTNVVFETTETSEAMGSQTANKTAITVELPRWTKTEVEDFLKAEFDIKRCSPMLVKFVHNKTGGIPAMCKALVRDHHLVFVKNGGQLDCSAIEKLGDLALGFKESDIHFPVPASIQSYFGKMIDALNDYNNSQFILITLKTAALICVGQEFQSLAFALDTLRACHPLFNSSDEYFHDEFEEAIEILEFEGFIREGEFEEERPDFYRNPMKKNFYFKGSEEKKTQKPSFYVFCSGFARDVIYNLMLFKQRSELHKQVSEVLRKYDELLTDSHMPNTEVRNALRRHQLLLQVDGMKSNFEIEEDQKELLLQQQQMQQAVAMSGMTASKHHKFVDSAQLYASSMQNITMMNPTNTNKRNSDLADIDMNQPPDGITPLDMLNRGGVGASTLDDLDEYDDYNMPPSPYAENAYSTLPPSVLVVFLKAAKNIPHLDAWQIPNLYVTFHYGNSKEQHLSRSVITSNSDDNDDPIWNEYAAIPLSTDLLISDTEQRLILKFWDYSPIRPDDDVMIGKINIDLLQLYEEQIQQHRHLENKLKTPRNSFAVTNFYSGLKKQLEDRDSIYVEKSLKMIIDDDLKQCVPNSKQPSTFEAMFKFCVLPNTAKNHHVNANPQKYSMEFMKQMQTKLHKHNMSQFSTVSGISHISFDSSAGNLNEHMRGMSSMPTTLPTLGGIGGGTIPSGMVGNHPHHGYESTGLDKYVSQLKQMKQQKQREHATSSATTVTVSDGTPVPSSFIDELQHNNDPNQHLVAPGGGNENDRNKIPLLKAYSDNDSYFLAQLENEEEIDIVDVNASQDFDPPYMESIN